MKIKWLGTATLLIQSGETTIALDPYLKRNPKLSAIDVSEVAHADAALITHPHFDHFSDVETFVRAGLPVVYVEQQGLDSARKNGFSQETIDALRTIGVGERLKVGEMTVTAYRGKHCTFDFPTVLGTLFHGRVFRCGKALFARLKEHRRFPLKKSTTLIFDITDGNKRVTVLGSAGMKSSEVYPKGADLLVFPYQGRSGMHRYSMPFVERFQPKRVMLDHFDDAFPPITKQVNTDKFMPLLQEKYPDVKGIVPTENVWYEL